MRRALLPWQTLWGFQLDVQDVDIDPALVARYDELVPVLVAVDDSGEIELCHYHLNEAALRNYLARVSAPLAEKIFPEPGTRGDKLSP